jgi:hypothetical protein
VREIGIVPTDIILATVWPDVSSAFARHGMEWMEENELNEDDIFLKVSSSEWQLWLGTDEVNLDAIMITRLRGTELHILFLGGAGLSKYLLEGLEMIERFALHHNANEVVLWGREGWDRLLDKFGYAHKGARIVKDLVKAYAH